MLMDNNNISKCGNFMIELIPKQDNYTTIFGYFKYKILW